jgi:phospholipase/lecithinase/hemolysin
VRNLHAASLIIALLLAGCGSDDAPSPPVDGGTPPPANGGGTPPVSPVSALFVLGDSLSDVGNAASLTDYLLGKPLVPPTVGLCNSADVLVVPRPCDDLFFRRSRVSDGPVAVEHLAAHLGVAELTPSFHVLPSRPGAGTDYAVASAKARGPAPEDLAQQVDRLLLDRGSLPADALFVVMIGGNDAIDALQVAAAGGPNAAATSTAIVADAVAAIGASLERLVVVGARRIVVANVPDLAALPAVLETARASGNEGALLAVARSISEDFDRELGALLAQVASAPRVLTTPLVLVRFDLRAALLAAQQSTAAAGGNAGAACFDSEAYRQSAAAHRVFHADCSPAAGGAPRFAGFVFWDGIHPTGATHAALGAALSARVDAELAVP